MPPPLIARRPPPPAPDPARPSSAVIELALVHHAVDNVTDFMLEFDEAERFDEFDSGPCSPGSAGM